MKDLYDDIKARLLPPEPAVPKVAVYGPVQPCTTGYAFTTNTSTITCATYTPSYFYVIPL